MPKIEIRCPACSKKGYMEVDGGLLDKKMERGIMTINLGKNQICEHTFVAYIDNNLKVRDCFLTDFQIELPELAPSELDQEMKIPSSEDLDINLIKMNFYPLTLTFILRGGFFNKKMLVLSENQFLNNYLKNFFEYIYQNSYNLDLRLMSREKYNKNKKEYGDFLIIDNKKIIRDNDKILDVKKLKIERVIIQRFYSESIPNSGLLILKNEIYKTYLFSKTIVDFIKEFKGEELLSKNILDNLEEVHNVEIQIPYLDFLLEIVKNYFNVEVPKASKISDFLKF
ncbi:MAG: hypothetical protein EU529_09160 [Promethearchaeota archaeon]|nr:MAG: hypothetical protein EU529_09160 [Candidatus Lokiarchaeota archaeon]